MNIFTIFSIIVINFILESTILSYFSIFGVLPNTSLIIIGAIALLRGRKTGSIVGLVMGLLQDIVFSPVIGVNAFIYFFIGYSIGMAENNLSKDNALIPFVITIGSTIGYHLLYYFFMFFLGHNINFPVFFKKIVIFEIAYNSLLSILFYKWFSRIFVIPSIRFGKK